MRELPDGSTARVLWDTLAREFAELDNYRDSVSTAVNAEYTKMSQVLAEGDEVAFLPPVSGGSTD
jgi:molybdopterin converting factor small subunit